MGVCPCVSHSLFHLPHDSGMEYLTWGLRLVGLPRTVRRLGWSHMGSTEGSASAMQGARCVGSLAQIAQYERDEQVARQLQVGQRRRGRAACVRPHCAPPSVVYNPLPHTRVERSIKPWMAT